MVAIMLDPRLKALQIVEILDGMWECNLIGI
jgi:hypothetical protein